MGLNLREAARMFRLIDLDDVGSISLVDIHRAFLLSEPGLFMETARKKGRRRWRSIQEAFKLHRDEVATYGIHERPRDELDSRLLEKASTRGLQDCTEADFKSLPEMQSKAWQRSTCPSRTPPRFSSASMLMATGG